LLPDNVSYPGTLSVQGVKARAAEGAVIRQQPAGDAEIRAAVHTSTNRVDP